MNSTLDAPQPLARDIPLAVDLDGTLVDTDTLFEGVAQLLARRPTLMLRLPWWLMKGKAEFKREIASRVDLDVQFLPYREELVQLLRNERERRTLVLCTAAHSRFAHAVANHTGLFDHVIATETDINLEPRRKVDALVQLYGARGFDYLGNDVADLTVFGSARSALVVSPTPALRRKMPGISNLLPTLGKPQGSVWPPLFRAMRPHQWIKNLLVFLPILATLQMSNLEVFVPATIAFLAFCLIASSVYLLNDLFDINADRRHPRKRNRPFAGGSLPIKDGAIMIPLLIGAGFLLASQISSLFSLVLCVYFICTTLYTFWLKRVVLLDTLVLAGLYTLRILAGAAAIAVVPSFWLLAFSMFFFLSIALAKRHSELLELVRPDRAGSIPGREYRLEDADTLIAQGSASGYAAVLVLALFINSDAVREQYNNPEIIWLVCPLLLYWINKLWLNSQRREVEDDPLVWAMSNRVSRGIAALSVLLLLLARWLPPFAGLGPP